MIPLGEWRPDLAPFESPGLIDCANLIPHNVYETRSGVFTTYSAFRGLNRASEPLPDRPRGAIHATDRDGNVVVVAGTGERLYTQAGQSWLDATRTAGPYTSLETQAWEFARYGDRILASNQADPIQTLEFREGRFRDLIRSTLKPRARSMAVVGNHLVLANLVEQGVNHPQRIRWSALDDVSDFNPSAETLSDNRDLFGPGGSLTKIVGGENGVIFAENAIWLLSYVGGDSVFQIDQVETNRGTKIPGSVIAHGHFVYFHGLDGFYVMPRGGQSRPIGDGKVDDWFAENLNKQFSDRVTASVHPDAGLIMWAFPSKESEDGTPDRLLCYRWALDRWSPIYLSTHLIFSSATPGLTLPDLDVYGTLDELPAPLSDPRWAGGQPMLAAFDANYRLCQFDGEWLQGSVETSEQELSAGRRTFVRSVRPIVDADDDTITVSLGTRNRLTEPVSYSSPVAVNRLGECPQLSDARYHRARIAVSGGFRALQGLDLEARPSGRA